MEAHSLVVEHRKGHKVQEADGRILAVDGGHSLPDRSLVAEVHGLLEEDGRDLVVDSLEADGHKLEAVARDHRGQVAVHMMEVDSLAAAHSLEAAHEKVVARILVVAPHSHEEEVHSQQVLVAVAHSSEVALYSAPRAAHSLEKALQRLVARVAEGHSAEGRSWGALDWVAPGGLEVELPRRVPCYGASFYGDAPWRLGLKPNLAGAAAAHQEEEATDPLWVGVLQAGAHQK